MESQDSSSVKRREVFVSPNDIDQFVAVRAKLHFLNHLLHGELPMQLPNDGLLSTATHDDDEDETADCGGVGQTFKHYQREETRLRALQFELNEADYTYGWKRPDNLEFDDEQQLLKLSEELKFCKDELEVYSTLDQHIASSFGNKLDLGDSSEAIAEVLRVMQRAAQIESDYVAASARLMNAAETVDKLRNLNASMKSSLSEMTRVSADRFQSSTDDAVIPLRFARLGDSYPIDWLESKQELSFMTKTGGIIQMHVSSRYPAAGSISILGTQVLDLSPDEIGRLRHDAAKATCIDNWLKLLSDTYSDR